MLDPRWSKARDASCPQLLSLRCYRVFWQPKWCASSELARQSRRNRLGSIRPELFSVLECTRAGPESAIDGNFAFNLHSGIRGRRTKFRFSRGGWLIRPVMVQCQLNVLISMREPSRKKVDYGRASKMHRERSKRDQICDCVFFKRTERRAKESRFLMPSKARSYIN